MANLWCARGRSPRSPFSPVAGFFLGSPISGMACWPVKDRREEPMEALCTAGTLVVSTSLGIGLALGALHLVLRLGIRAVGRGA